MLNAMALKEKRDSVAIPNQTVKRKRKLKDDLSRKSLKKSGNKIGKQFLKKIHFLTESKIIIKKNYLTSPKHMTLWNHAADVSVKCKVKLLRKKGWLKRCPCIKISKNGSMDYGILSFHSVSVSDFENHWKMVKVGHKYVTMPKNATVISQGE